MIREAISRLAEKKDLSQETMTGAMEEIMSGQASAAQIAAYLLGLRMKGETVDEITCAAQVMRRHVTKIKSRETFLLDTCGTGGDSSGTFNVSTISALVASGAGVKVAKHGNRSVSSKCGSADLLMALGVKIDIAPEKIEKCLEEIGFAFLYAPLLHPAMKYATPVRREMGIRTIFNILGPLTNPASASNQLLGVYDKGLTETLARVLKNLGTKHALVVHGEDGLDEVTTVSKTLISELKDGRIKNYKIKPGQFALSRTSREDLKGGDAAFNAKIAYDILRGKGDMRRSIVLLNAGCAIYAADKAASIKEGVIKAATSIDSGAALEKLELLKEFTNG
ncbi:MAG: anthranilate phosphoribosyltransferase [Candidatus Omnitrophota bacterium]|nr:MAG: anthranilate phosphoribosyltransferase [Candidatus Omnitrophota bacterium]